MADTDDPTERQSCPKGYMESEPDPGFAKDPIASNFEVSISTDKKKSPFGRLLDFLRGKGKVRNRMQERKPYDPAYRSDPRFDRRPSVPEDGTLPANRCSAPSGFLETEFALNRQWAELDVNRPSQNSNRPEFPPVISRSTDFENISLPSLPSEDLELSKA